MIRCGYGQGPRAAARSIAPFPALLLPLFLALSLLTACNGGPYPGIGIGVNRHGVSAYPHVSGNLGGVGVSLGGLID